ncbi:MAG: DUF3768 domain-containing protein [Psychrosphaera sp.]|nr:DUF3768 domain-containing protein [Psychrosphaera sp.]
MDKYEKIVQLNDSLRTENIGGQVIESKAVKALAEYNKNELYLAIKECSDFADIDGTPNEHNYGVFALQYFPTIYELDGLGNISKMVPTCQFVWAIDYFDNTLDGPSLDPGNPEITKRILTIRTAIEVVATLNDEFRQAICGAEVRKSPSLENVSQFTREGIYTAVRMFDNFESDANPHPEHEFGVLKFGGQLINWQIDYFNRALNGASADPCNPALTKRVMTISTATETIATLNDQLRRHGIGGKVMITRSIAYLPESRRAELIQAVREFDDFGNGNDPHGEHKHGDLIIDGQHIRWKIDYYDENLEFGAEVPCDESATSRVLTITVVADR